MDDKGAGLDMNALAQAMAMRYISSAGEESVIREEWKNIIESRHKVRVRQFFAGILGSLAAFLGLGFVGLPLGLSGAVSSLGDILLMGCAATLAALLFWSGVELSLKEHTRRRRWVVTGIGATLILATLCLAALRLGDAEWWHPLSIVAGLSIIRSAVLLVFNQESELADPMGWSSSWEGKSWELIDWWMKQQQAPLQIIERPLFAWRHNNREQHISAQVKGDSDNRISVPAQDDLTLADFLQECTKRPLGRDRHWLGRGKVYTCPSTGVRVTRPVYDKMIGMMERLGYIERGGDGGGHTWLTEPQAAYEDWCSRLEAEWGDILGGGDDDGNG